MEECIHISQGFQICKSSFHYSKSQELTTWRFTSILYSYALINHFHTKVSSDTHYVS